MSTNTRTKLALFAIALSASTACGETLDPRSQSQTRHVDGVERSDAEVLVGDTPWRDHIEIDPAQRTLGEAMELEVEVYLDPEPLIADFSSCEAIDREVTFSPEELIEARRDVLLQTRDRAFTMCGSNAYNVEGLAYTDLSYRRESAVVCDTAIGERVELPRVTEVFGASVTALIRCDASLNPGGGDATPNGVELGPPRLDLTPPLFGIPDQVDPDLPICDTIERFDPMSVEQITESREKALRDLVRRAESMCDARGFLLGDVTFSDVSFFEDTLLQCNDGSESAELLRSVEVFDTRAFAAIKCGASRPADDPGQPKTEPNASRPQPMPLVESIEWEIACDGRWSPACCSDLRCCAAMGGGQGYCLERFGARR